MRFKRLLNQKVFILHVSRTDHFSNI